MPSKSKYDEGWDAAIDCIISEFKRDKEYYTNSVDEEELQQLKFINSMLRIITKYKNMKSNE